MKKHFRIFPSWIDIKLRSIDEANIILTSRTRLRLNSEPPLPLGIQLEDEIPAVGEPFFPEPTGKYSQINTNGEEIVRKDLPKERHTNYIEAPNWGDASKGTHTVELPYYKYPRELIAPQGIMLQATILTQIDDSEALFEISTVQPVDKEDRETIFFILNLLQENYSNVDVRGESGSPTPIVQQVSWEIFPPEEKDKVIARLLAGKSPQEVRQSKIPERMEFLSSFSPELGYVVGSAGFETYIGAKFRNNLVIFENTNYGNALYFLYEDWERLSQLSRTQLLTKGPGEFDRVVHTRGWEHRVENILREHGIVQN